jgi:hypothetical protein
MVDTINKGAEVEKQYIENAAPCEEEIENSRAEIQ